MSNLEIALGLAKAGWNVLPLNGKQPAFIEGLITRGHLDASRDHDTIRAWWSKRGDYNIGAVIPENLLVLDIDPHNGGSQEALEAAAGVALPRTLETVSGRGDGGRHLYYFRPFDNPYRRNIPEGIDVKTNGYMVMPPSIHPASGKPYRWIKREVAALPEEVIALMLPRKRKPMQHGTGANPAALASWIRTLRPGERHDGLHWAARRAHEAGMNDLGLRILADAAEDIGVPRHEAERVIESAMKGNRA